jgi:sugar phosphate isomerase/epimerase
MKISASITDFPIFSHVKTFFHEFHEAGVDGVEMVLGIKSRWQLNYIKQLSREYQLPITSVHQPAWSGTGIYFDKHFVEWAKELGTNAIVFHPLSFTSFASRTMEKYLKKLASLQEEFDIVVLFENMPKDFVYKKLYLPPYTTYLQHLEQTNIYADMYGLSLTYDVSHPELKQPQKELIFQRMFPKIANIHLSSFVRGHHHLPLNLGQFDCKGFVEYLVKKQYKGLVTLEVYYPELITLGNTYDFSAIAKSVKVFKEILDRLP